MVKFQFSDATCLSHDCLEHRSTVVGGEYGTRWNKANPEWRKEAERWECDRVIRGTEIKTNPQHETHILSTSLWNCCLLWIKISKLWQPVSALMPCHRIFSVPMPQIFTQFSIPLNVAMFFSTFQLLHRAYGCVGQQTFTLTYFFALFS